MQDADWQDLRLFLALARAGGFAAAARESGLHETTLARRLGRLERARGEVLWLPHAGGGAPTPAGRALLPRIAAAEAALAPCVAGPGPAAGGRVRLSTVPWLVAVLARHLAALTAGHPGLSLDLEAAQAARDPLRGAVDLALRFAAPEAGGDLVGRRLCDVPFGAFAMEGGEVAPWIGYTEAFAHLPQAGWHDRSAEGHRVSDLASAAHLVAAGCGRAWLPLALAPTGARRLDGSGRRPLWCLYHPRLRTAPALRAVLRWIEAEVVPDLASAVEGRPA